MLTVPPSLMDIFPVIWSRHLSVLVFITVNRLVTLKLSACLDTFHDTLSASLHPVIHKTDSVSINAKITFLDHYGAYSLSDHSWDDPVNRFVFRAKEKNIEYMTPLIGETVNIKEYNDYKEEWWKDVK